MIVTEHVTELSSPYGYGRIWFIDRWLRLTGQNLYTASVRAGFTFTGSSK